MSAELGELPPRDLLDQFEQMVQWHHYDPIGHPRPSNFDVDDLRAELLRRLGPPRQASDEDDA